MKQAQSSTTRNIAMTGRLLVSRSGDAREFATDGSRLALPMQAWSDPTAWSWGEMLVTLMGTLWFLVTLPFRLVFWTIAWLGQVDRGRAGVHVSWWSAWLFGPARCSSSAFPYSSSGWC